MNGANIAFKIPIKMKRRLNLYTTVSKGQSDYYGTLRTRQLMLLDSCSLGTPSSLVPFCQTSTPSDKIVDSTQEHA
jgi:hypothetical protein